MSTSRAGWWPLKTGNGCTTTTTTSITTTAASNINYINKNEFIRREVVEKWPLWVNIIMKGWKCLLLFLGFLSCTERNKPVGAELKCSVNVFYSFSQRSSLILLSNVHTSFRFLMTLFLPEVVGLTWTQSTDEEENEWRWRNTVLCFKILQESPSH